MPLEIVRNDITKMAVDAIVNTADTRPVVGAGVDAMIHQKAGPRLLQARREIGTIAVGSAAVTPGFDLPAKFVIHTAGPIWHGGIFREEKQLRSCYDAALKLAMENGCQSVAFPLISSGYYGFPKDKALQIAISAFSEFLMEQEMHIYLVVFDRAAFRLSGKLFQSIASYIDENYVDHCEKRAAAFEGRHRRMPTAEMVECAASCPRPRSLPMADYVESLEEILKQEDAGFTQTLLKLIDRSGKKDSEIYKKANLSKQHFSKIRNNPHYKPTKPTAIALALALKLNLDETKDLIGRAGYALTNSSKFDLIIRFFIEHGNYDVMQINLVLYEFDQSLLGA